MEFAPIILFVYNRPYHTEQTLKALSENVFAEQSRLFIFCDGPKKDATNEHIDNIQKVRSIVKSKKWCGNVSVIESDVNKGLSSSIIAGVTKVLDKYGKAIVLEDDLKTSPWFLKYMNEALTYYEDRKSVFSIGACRPPLSKMQIPKDYEYDVFVGLRSYSWGWATWKDRWDQVDWSMDYMASFLTHPEQIKAFNRAGDDMTKLLRMQYEGSIDSWAMRFGFAHFFNHAIAILPCVSYVDNIGFDGTGTHCGKVPSLDYSGDIHFAPEKCRFLDVLYEDSRIINAFYSSFYPARRPLWQRACNFIARKLGRKPPFIIKQKVYSF